MEAIETRCCIAGGGPAGLMLGYLLARAGVGVVVLEKHADFLRDFRGDTIHPSTLEVMRELGLLEGLLALPHRKVTRLAASLAGRPYGVADFRDLPALCKYVAFMPQWHFLNYLAAAAARFPAFTLRQCADVTGLLREGNRVVGVRADTPSGPLEVRAALVVGADGRHSTVRQAAGMRVEALGAPMDVLWFRLDHAAGDSDESFGVFGAGAILVLIDRGSHWQCGYVIPKNGFNALKAAGLEAFHARIAGLAPFLAERAAAITGWEQVKLLTVAVNRLTEWSKPGLLCIGDAAHAMSPLGGVGVNLAIQDAVATANLLAEPLRQGVPSEEEVQAVQRRRTWPATATQSLQVMAQRRIIARVLQDTAAPTPPFALRMLDRYKWLQRLPGRLIGMGLRPEHVRTPLRAAAGTD